MNDQGQSGTPDTAMEAIRDLVESKRDGLERLGARVDEGIVDLDDVVWRSPSRPVVDPTETITRLAEEADKVADGKAARPPRAAILREDPDLVSGPAPDRIKARADKDRRPPSFADQEAEQAIRALLMQSLGEQGKIDASGRIMIPEDELKIMVREQIDTWLARHPHAGSGDALHETADLRKNSAHRKAPPDQD